MTTTQPTGTLAGLTAGTWTDGALTGEAPPPAEGTGEGTAPTGEAAPAPAPATQGD